MKFRRPHFGVGDKAKAHSLTGPTNLVSIVGHVPAPAEAPALPVQPTPSLTELDGQVDAMLAEMRFSSAVPINAWIRRADTLKRQADQHHIAGDLARQYVCLAACAVILGEWLPFAHKGWRTLDDETQAHILMNAQTIQSMVTLTREALTDDASPPISATGRSSRQEAPRRSSLRSSRPTSLTQTPGRPPAKHVSFVSDDDASSISPRSSISITPQPLRAVHVPRREPSIASSHSSSSSSSSSLRVDPVPTYASPPAPAPAARTHPAPVAVHMQALSLTAEPNLHVMASRRAAEPPPPVDPSLRGARPATPKPRTRPSPPSDVSASQEEHPPPRVHSRASTRPSQLRSTPSRRFLTAEPLVTMVVAKPPSSETPTSAPPRVSVDDAMATHMSEHQQQQGYVPTDHAESRSLEAVGRILLKAPGTMNKLALRAAAATMLRKAPASHAWPARPSSSSDAGWGAAPPSPPHAVPTTTWTRRVSSSSDLHVLATGRRPSSPPKTEAQQPLRPIVLPAIVATKFLALAEAHTRADIETIGILLGRGEGTLHVTHLLLPPQHGTSVSCVAHGEETILAYQLDNDLMTLGWIHTHPTQTCFLSSLDLHTHASFQALLPEAIAVVCAPSKQPSLGVFRLTNPPGLQFVLHCNDPAPFHPHVVPGDPQHTLPLYTDVAASHVQWSEEAPLRILDWRHKAA